MPRGGDGQITLAVATWNVLAEEYLEKYARQGGYHGLQPAVRIGRSDRVISLIRLLAARNDLLFLQESEEDLVAALRRDGLPTGFAPRAPGKRNGLAWIAGPHVRVLRVSVKAIDLREASPPEAPLGRNWVCLETEIAGHPVRAAGTHLTPDAVTLQGIPAGQGGAAQAALILAGLPPGPWAADLVLGDLNARPGDTALAALEAAGFTPLHPPPGHPDATAAIDREAGQGWERIDWILSRGVAPGSARLLPPPATELPLPGLAMPSDHLPLEARLPLPFPG